MVRMKGKAEVYQGNCKGCTAPCKADKLNGPQKGSCMLKKEIISYGWVEGLLWKNPSGNLGCLPRLPNFDTSASAHVFNRA